MSRSTSATAPRLARLVRGGARPARRTGHAVPDAAGVPRARRARGSASSPSARPGLRHVALATDARRPARAGRAPRPPRDRLPARAPPRQRLDLLRRPRRHDAGGHGPDGVGCGAVVRFVFSVEDLARTRFAISPMLGARPLAGRAARPVARRAARAVAALAERPARRARRSSAAIALIPPRGYIAGLPPAAAEPARSGSIEDDLAALRATPLAQIRDEMELFRSQHPRRASAADAGSRTRAARCAGSPTCSRPTGSARSRRCGRGSARSSTPTSPTGRGGWPTAGPRRCSPTSPTA